jgi:hypothetical protein
MGFYYYLKGQYQNKIDAINKSITIIEKRTNTN